MKTEKIIIICDQEFELDIDYFSLDIFTEIDPPSELKKLKLFPNLQTVNLFGTNLEDQGLSYLCESKIIVNINVQDTQISNAGLAHLASLPNLEHLRLKENAQLTNSCVGLLNNLSHLKSLSINETNIDQEGLALLNLTGLELLVTSEWNGQLDYEEMLSISSRLSTCEIVVKGRGAFFGGEFSGSW